MNRILILGSPGSGKSTFARKLAARTGIPLFHMDQLYWHPGWVPSEEEDFMARLQAVVDQPRWIIDGNFAKTLAMRLEKADLAVHLDRSRWTCLRRVLRRIRTQKGQVRPDMAPGCPERFNWEFVHFVLTFPNHTGRNLKAILREASDSGTQVQTFRNDQASEAWLAQVPTRN